VMQGILEEYHRAISKHAPFNSCHEGYAVIKEELDELWDLVRKSRDRISRQGMTIEAMQVGAMAFRFLIELTNYKLKTKEK